MPKMGGSLSPCHGFTVRFCMWFLTFRGKVKSSFGNFIALGNRFVLEPSFIVIVCLTSIWCNERHFCYELECNGLELEVLNVSWKVKCCVGFAFWICCCCLSAKGPKTFSVSKAYQHEADKIWMFRDKTLGVSKSTVWYTKKQEHIGELTNSKQYFLLWRKTPFQLLNRSRTVSGCRHRCFRGYSWKTPSVWWCLWVGDFK